MALSAKVKGLVKKAIQSLDDLASTVTYVQVVPGVYNPATDVVASTTTTHTLVPAVLAKLDETDLDWWPANMIGQKVLIAYNDLPIVPTDDDYMTIDGNNWNVYRIKGVPGGSLHIFYVREP